MLRRRVRRQARRRQAREDTERFTTIIRPTDINISAIIGEKRLSSVILSLGDIITASSQLEFIGVGNGNARLGLVALQASNSIGIGRSHCCCYGKAVIREMPVNEVALIEQKHHHHFVE